MTRDEIIRMAREACDPDKVDAWKNGFWTLTQEELERIAALVAEAEREACAKVAESLPMQQEIDVRDQCAAAIRARKTK
jgi:hypothetical protein